MLLTLGGCAGPFSMGKEPLTLVWYGLARHGTFQHPTYVPLGDGIALANDDGIQLFITVDPDAYTYVLHQTVTGQFVLLWPTQEGEFNALMRSRRIHTLPSRGRVYTMPFARGVEAIYIIAAREAIESVDDLVREMRALFTSAQALAAGIPANRVRDGLPNDLVWNLDLKNPGPISVVDQHIPIGATIQGIGARHVGDEQVTTTAEGGHYSVRAEQIRGKDIVARIVRVRRVADR